MGRTTDLDLSTERIARLTSAGELAGFFTSLGYRTDVRRPLSAEAIGLAGDAAAPIREIELFAEDVDGFLRVVLVHLKSLTAHAVTIDADGFGYARGRQRKIDCHAVYKLLDKGLWWPLLAGKRLATVSRHPINGLAGCQGTSQLGRIVWAWRRFAGVDRATDRAHGGRGGTGFGARHRWSSFRGRMKRMPFVCVPVIFFATALSDRKTSPSYSNPLASTRTWSFCPL